MLAFVSSPFLGGFLFGEIVYRSCSLDERTDYVVPGDGGYTVSYYLKACGGGVGSEWDEGVYAERSRFPWPWPETKQIFSYKPTGYFGSTNVGVTVTGTNTVTVSAEEVVEVFRAETNWGTLKIDYNIGSIRNPRPTDPIR